MDSEFYSLEQSDPTSARNTLRTIVSYLRLLWRYRLIVVAFVAIAAFIGVVKYKRTPRKYQASASMLIRFVAGSKDLEGALATKGLLAGYKQLLTSDAVLLATSELLEEKPPELRGADPIRHPAVLRSMLTVSYNPKENVVNVSCRSRDPEATAAVIHALQEASQNFIEDDRYNMSNRLVAKLDEERAELESRLAQGNRALLEARKASGDLSSLSGSDESHPAIQRVTELSTRLTQTRSRRVELDSMRQTTQRLSQAGQDLSQLVPLIEEFAGRDAIERIPGLAGVSQDVIMSIEDSLHEVTSKLTELRQHYGSRHPEIVRLETQRTQLQQRLEAAHRTNRNRVAGGIRDPQVAAWMLNAITNEFNRTRQFEWLLEQEYEQAQSEVLDLNVRLANVELAEREVETLQNQHSSVLNRLNSIDLGQMNDSFRVAPLTEPLTPKRPVAPVLTQILGVHISLAVIASLLVVYIIDLVDDRLRSPEEVQDQLGLPMLGIVRPLPEDEISDHHIYVHAHPLSVQTECFRTVRTSISLSDSDTKCLAITSSEQSEGKTTLTVNLAATFAQTGSRTLLIDADMRRPGLSKLLEIRGQGGLSEILRANENVQEMCVERTVRTDVPGLDVLPCGPRMMNAGVLLSMPSLAAILDWAVSQYDQVLVDCPPTLPVSDASIVGNYVDGMLFLLNPEKTHRRSALRAVDQLRSVGMNLVGVVTNSSTEAHASSYGYGYGYGQEYSYGHDEHEHEDGDELYDEEYEHSDVDRPVAGSTLRPLTSSQPRYSLLSDSDDESSTDPHSRAA